MKQNTIKLIWEEAFPFCFVLLTPRKKGCDPVVLSRIFMENDTRHPKYGYWRLQSYVTVFRESARHPIESQHEGWGERKHDIDLLARLARLNAESWADKIGIQIEIDSSALDALTTTLKGYQQMEAERDNEKL